MAQQQQAHSSGGGEPMCRSSTLQSSFGCRATIQSHRSQQTAPGETSPARHATDAAGRAEPCARQPACFPARQAQQARQPGFACNCLSCCRYSVFGWYLQPGKLYELYTGEGEEKEEQRQAQAAADVVAAAAGAPGGQHAAAEQQTQQRQKKKGKQKRQQGASREPEDVPADAPQCKLAQRLLAKLAAGQQRGQLQLLTEG